MKDTKLLFISALVVLIASCGKNKSEGFRLPDGVGLTDYQLFDYKFASHLVQPPVPPYLIFNDSILKLATIQEIELVHKGGKNPDSITEKSIYKFNKSGLLTEFSFFNYEIDPGKLTSIQYKYNAVNELESATIPLFFAQNKNEEYLKIHRKADVVFIRKGVNNRFDSIFVNRNEGNLLILEKMNDFLTSVQVFIDESTPLSRVNELLKPYNIPDEQLLLATKTVTYLHQNLPQKSYEFDEEFRQSQLVASWEYEENQKLIGFKQFINNTIVKELVFGYDERKLLSSFTYNNKRYLVIYH